MLHLLWNPTLTVNQQLRLNSLLSFPRGEVIILVTTEGACELALFLQQPFAADEAV